VGNTYNTHSTWDLFIAPDPQPMFVVYVSFRCQYRQSTPLNRLHSAQELSPLLRRSMDLSSRDNLNVEEEAPDDAVLNAEDD
jgi:hypothetical protein